MILAVSSILITSLLWQRTVSTPIQTVRPLVIWHGLGDLTSCLSQFRSIYSSGAGDAYAAKGILEFASRIKEIHPGITIHSVYIDEDLERDRRAGFVRCLSCLLLEMLTRTTNSMATSIAI